MGLKLPTRNLTFFSRYNYIINCYSFFFYPQFVPFLEIKPKGRILIPSSYRVYKLIAGWEFFRKLFRPLRCDIFNVLVGLDVGCGVDIVMSCLS